MKKAMKLNLGILAIAVTMAAGTTLAPTAAAQNPDAIDNARSVAKSLQQKQTNDSNAALDAAGVPEPSKPAPGAPAPAVRPAVIPGSNPAPAPAPKAAATAKPAAKTAAKPAASSDQNNQLQSVKVAQGSGQVQIQIQASGSVTPRVSKLSSPARVLVELPETALATAQTRIPVNSAGVKGVRIGMDGKTPPTTSVVVDLEKACAYEMGSGPAGQLILTLHTEGASQETAQTSSAPAKAAPAAQLKTVAGKPGAVPAPKAAVAKATTAKPAAAAKPAAPAKAAVAADSGNSAAVPKAPEPKKEDKKWAMSGKRDPFFSPVVQQPTGSGCSTGKKCLEIGNINLRGVVKSESGFIAVVTNNLNKAYFLRENDPVFNGYVVKITGDSVVFQETVQDKLGKPFTREIVKRIFTPAV
ncbi:MAG TPA: AMIN domain-containing protein [Candidatus Sulfotelmatobacter sp.]|nr:AMIN domain-containing protein [Candidatus Sulfotelmatobacter sp.]